MKKTLLSFLFLFGIAKLCSAQDFAWGQVSSEDLKAGRYAKDTSAHAVVLQEYGSSRITVAQDDEIKVFTQYHVKIKIFDSKGFDEATTAIKLRNSSDKTEVDEMEKVEGVTYNLDGSGAIQQTTFDPSKLYITRDYKEQSTLKFTMPGLAPGCIIEYKYTLVSPLSLSLDHFHTWYFQSDIPKVYSEFEAIIPGHFTYNAALHGYLKLSKSDGQIERGCFSTHGASSDCSDIKYGMRDIPAFVEEEYMTSTKNYISSITFDLVEFTNPYTGLKVNETKDWHDIDLLLKGDDDFGGQLKRTSVFKDRMVPVVAGSGSDLDKAKAVYAYIQQNFKWNDYVGFDAYLGVKKAYESHSGSIADINIALIDALNSIGINTEAVLLSTRENGFINELYPAINSFNYVIAKANIGDKTYLLDATDRLLPFGMLPFKCLNGKARVFSLDKPSYWIDLNVPQKEISTASLNLTLQDDGKLKGTFTRYSIGYEGYDRREQIKKFNSIDEYVEDVASAYPKLKILKSQISNIDSLENPVVEKYDVEIVAFDKTDADKLAFNPFFLSKITTNPFTQPERSYPVDMGMPGDYRTIMTIHMPQSYKIQSPPQNISQVLPNNGGRFLTDYQNDGDVFTFSHIIQFTKSSYAPEEYANLKEFYNKIIQSEKTEMIIARK